MSSGRHETGLRLRFARHASAPAQTCWAAPHIGDIANRSRSSRLADDCATVGTKPAPAIHASPSWSRYHAIGARARIGLLVRLSGTRTLSPTPGDYEVARFNALRHGVLSQYTVLPWE